MLIIEGRLVLIDGFLHAFAAVTILGVAVLAANPDSMAAVIFAGAAAGCTYSVKYTGAGVVPFLALFIVLQSCRGSLTNLFRLKKREDGILKAVLRMPLLAAAGKCLVVAAVSVTVMYICFVIHVIVLDFRSSEDSFMPQEFRSTLVRVNTKDYSPRTKGMPMFRRILTLIKVMHRSNMGITSEHAAASRWWEWPLVLMDCVTYFSNRYALVLHPSPFVWYPALLGPVTLLILAAVGYFAGNSDLTQLVIWPVGYFGSWLPFALVPRVLFVYHYLLPLIFGVFSFVIAIDVILGSHRTAKTCFFAIWCLLSLGSWIFFAPWCYAMEGYDWGIRAWYPWIFEGRTWFQKRKGK
jgi:dolichyl-phosphate-mannose--protein O-mannosyl transferase